MHHNHPRTHPFYHIQDGNCYLHKNEKLLPIQLMEIAICLDIPLIMKIVYFSIPPIILPLLLCFN